jgi:pantoate--beta-alanine ligase
MLSVVMKLLQISKADRAYFGEKDYQQLQLVRGLVRAFFVPTEIVSCPIVRDAEGLALSSRNLRLSAEGINRARRFAQCLSRTEWSLSQLESALSKIPVEIEYLEDHGDRRYAAVIVEGVRLIDNRQLDFRHEERKNA